VGHRHQRWADRESFYGLHVGGSSGGDFTLHHTHRNRPGDRHLQRSDLEHSLVLHGLDIAGGVHAESERDRAGRCAARERQAGDFGQPRAQNKQAEKALLAQRILGFFDHYLRGSGPGAALGATAFTETCPAAAPSGGPFSATTWSALHPGQVSLSSPTTQTILSAAGDPAIAAAIDPVGGRGACATVSARDQGTGVDTYRLPAAGAAGYTLLGAPTVTAALTVSGTPSYIAARLWDVDPGANTETLVSRGVYRVNAAQPQGTQSFQLHPGAWYFAPGHVAKLELLAQALWLGALVVDLAADFRLKDPASYPTWYGAEHEAPQLLAEFA